MSPELSGRFFTTSATWEAPTCIRLYIFPSGVGDNKLKIIIFFNLVMLLLLSRFSHVQLCATPWMAAHWGYPRPWDSPGKNTGVGCHFLLQCMKGKSEK